MPLIWRNRIEQCAYDGIIVFGQHCEPDIRGNVIANNRKSGIKIMKNAIAHIGGTSKEDILDQLEKLHEVDVPDNLIQQELSLITQEAPHMKMKNESEKRK